VKFCKRFKPSDDCDYIVTDRHETALHEFGNDIWMSVTRSRGRESARDSLRCMLERLRMVYGLLFSAPVRDAATGQVDAASRSRLHMAFEMLIGSAERVMEGVDDLLKHQPHVALDPDFLSGLSVQISDMFRSGPFAYMSLLYSNLCVISTFPSEVTRALALALRMKLRYLFPRPRKGRGKGVRWMIGIDATAKYRPTRRRSWSTGGGSRWPC